MPEHAQKAVLGSKASENTKIHALYNHYYHEKSIPDIAQIYARRPETIRNWIRQSQQTGPVSRGIAGAGRQLTAEQRLWIREYFLDSPFSFLDEARAAFKSKWNKSISASRVWIILNDYGMQWKAAVEQRAIHLKETEILRFASEINNLSWTLYSIAFVGEASYDKKGMFRRRGYALKGNELVVRGEDYDRRPQLSTLTFLGCEGTLDTFSADGSFDRATYADCCRQFALEPRRVKYPGFYSIWIFDCAPEHQTAELVTKLRGLGIIPLFFPANYPFFSPMEVFFGLLEKRLRKDYSEGKVNAENLMLLVATALIHYRDYDFRPTFRQCGFVRAGGFDPAVSCESNAKEMGFH
ncbi:Serine kinase [Chytriomyces hyalinus]|nr:Serine kinase [Chytriomyces hyalinus]